MRPKNRSGSWLSISIGLSAESFCTSSAAAMSSSASNQHVFYSGRGGGVEPTHQTTAMAYSSTQTGGRLLPTVAAHCTMGSLKSGAAASETSPTWPGPGVATTPYFDMCAGRLTCGPRGEIHAQGSRHIGLQNPPGGPVPANMHRQLRSFTIKPFNAGSGALCCLSAPAPDGCPGKQHNV